MKYVKYSNGTIKNTVWYSNNKLVKKSTYTDKRDGITYKIITFAGQTWMAENLRSTKTTQGVDITWVVSNSNWDKMVFSDLGYCYYNNDPENGIIYGCLYNWETAKNVCPIGWHLPNDKEWTIFTNNIAKYFNLSVIADNTGHIDKVGGVLKSTSILSWTSSSIEASSKLGFFALMSGSRNIDGTFNSLEIDTHWWSSTERIISYAYTRNLYNNNEKIMRYKSNKSRGFSVRCIKN